MQVVMTGSGDFDEDLPEEELKGNLSVSEHLERVNQLFGKPLYGSLGVVTLICKLSLLLPQTLCRCSQRWSQATR